MKRKQRFIVNFAKDSKETFLSYAANTAKGIANNPDFENAPVKSNEFDNANQLMVAAAPNAVRTNIDGQRIFRPLRLTVEDMMTKLATYAQGTIGDKPDRMAVSGLPLTKEPVQRPDDINVSAEKAKLELGKTSGKITVSAKPNKAADGIVIEERQADLSLKEVAKVNGFKTSLNGYALDTVVVLQVRYWNNLGMGPRLAKPLAIVV